MSTFIMSQPLLPFVANIGQFQGPFETGEISRNFTGSWVTPMTEGLLLDQFKDGNLVTSKMLQFPKSNEISGGFNVQQHADGLEMITAIIGQIHRDFPQMAQSVASSGEVFTTSLQVKVISSATRKKGYFDLGAVESNGKHINYSCRNEIAFSHSGDQTATYLHDQSLVHAISFKQPGKGIIFLVGYEYKELISWHGTSPGLFVIDLTTKKSIFVPLNLAQMTIGQSTMIIPLWYEINQDGGISWYVPKSEEVETGREDTQTVYRSPVVSRLLLSMRFPSSDEQRHNIDHLSDDFAAISSGGSAAVSSQMNLEFPPHDCSPITITTSSKWNPIIRTRDRLFVGRSITKLQTEDVLFPLLFLGDRLSGRICLLRMPGISPGELEHTLSGRNIVILVDGKKGLDPEFLKAREGSNRTRINAVFIIQVDTNKDFQNADVSFISDIAGPQSTIVFQTKDGKYWFYWGTPQSVISRGILPQKINHEWLEFSDLLSEFLASPPEYRLVKIYDPLTTSIFLGEFGSVSFSTLHSFLDTIEFNRIDSDMQLKLLQSLFSFEFLLDKKEIEVLKKLIQSKFKTHMNSKDKMEFFNKICQEGRATTEIIGSIRKKRESLQEALKSIERIVALLASRINLSVNAFLSIFQEKLAGEGQKAQERMKNGLDLHKFAEDASLEDLFARINENDDLQRIDEFVMFQIHPNVVHDFIILDQIGSPFAVQNERLQTLNSETIEAIGSLEIEHSLMPREGIPIAIPVKHGYHEILSMMALPIFKEMVPNFENFHVGIWPHVLKFGFKRAMIFPRDHKFQLRELEFKIIEILLFILELLCSNRSSPVDRNSSDVDDELVKQIRSVYWLIFAFMTTNVSLMTPEPITDVMTSGKIKDAKVVSFAIRMLRAFPKTGLNPEYLKVEKSLYEIFMRALYEPFEDRFNLLAKLKKDADQKKNAVQKAARKEVSSSFFKDSVETTSSIVKPKLRPKYCIRCHNTKTLHDFPRNTQLMMDSEGKIKETFLDQAICFECQGYPEPILICPRESCLRKNKPQTRFDINSGYNSRNGKYSSPYCYTCLKSTIGIPEKTRQVPPSYLKYFGLESKAVSFASAVSSVSTVPLPVVRDMRLDISSIWKDGQIVGIDQIETITIGTPVSLSQYVMLAQQFGLLTPTDDQRIVCQELTNLVCMMLDNFQNFPAWKEVVNEAMKRKHRMQEAIVPSEIHFSMNPPKGAMAIAGPEEEDSEEHSSEEMMVPSSKKRCIIM